jgi:RNA polymerase sigma-70 factor (ECF subfamily)
MRKPDDQVTAMTTATEPARKQSVHETADERDLVSRAAAGEHAAYEAIMRRHNRALYRTARSVLRNDADAEEAVQESYIAAYRHLGSFRGQSSLATWLTRIVINESLQRLRRRKSEIDTVPADNVINLDAHMAMAYDGDRRSETPEDALAREQARRLLERRIDELPSAFRTVFVLRALEELSVEECAACLQVPEATVRTRYFRARQLLRKSLTRDMTAAAPDAFAFDGERCDRIVQAVLARLPTQPPGG